MRLIAIASLLLLAACASSPQRQGGGGAPAVRAADFGLTREAAIEVCEPAGQRAYLASLACPDGRRPEFERTGNVGARQDLPGGLSEADTDRLLDDMFSKRPLRAGEPDHHIVDAYRVACGGTATTLYLDMYHCGTKPPSVAPAGFTFGP